ncbi:MAG: DUF3267 domain-containing protein [Lagierella massiliensis]|nr:DUF3267 domain-containing protein [Lagierella massiliensis]
MKLHFRGKFDGDNSKLPTREHEDNYVEFNEPDNLEKFSIAINIMAILLTGLGLLFFTIHTGSIKNFNTSGAILAILTLFPHELLHAICFKEDVYLFTNLSKGMLFVTGTENISKKRAIFMNLLPNIVFGFVPFLIFLMNREMYLLGSMAVFTIGMGAGDYYNVFNIIVQMPKNSYTYIIGTSSYWFKLNESKEVY